MFFAPVCTTSNKLLTANLIVSCWSMSACQFFSKNSRTVLDERPIALAFHAEKMPLGSVKYSLGVGSSWSNPVIKHEMPNGRTPPD